MSFWLRSVGREMGSFFPAREVFALGWCGSLGLLAVGDDAIHGQAEQTQLVSQRRPADAEPFAGLLLMAVRVL